MNIKERILHIKNARAEDSGSYTCHTRSLHQKTWVLPNTFYVQVGEETKIKSVNQKVLKQQANPTTATLSTITKTTTNGPTSTKAPTTSLSMKTSTAPVVTTTSSTTTSTTASTTTSTTLPPTTQDSPPPSNKFDAGSFFGGMGLVE